MQSYRPGHHLHPIHRRHLTRTPWGWRSGTVTEAAPGPGGTTATVAYLDGGVVTVWHHEPIDGLASGYPVRVHEGLHALETGGLVLNVAVSGGCGPVPEPDDVDEWLRRHPPGPAVVVDLGTGRGVRERLG